MSSSSNSGSERALQSTSILPQVSLSRYSHSIFMSTKPFIPLTSPVSSSDEHHSRTSTSMLPSTTSFAFVLSSCATSTTVVSSTSIGFVLSSSPSSGCILSLSTPTPSSICSVTPPSTLCISGSTS
ncbi:hypothetical protein V8G54_015020 [Vigna mungo]|uniref:Uncharacterized protein n=1 Tax=Vigna mungo TaxID=3915 RepID=A0AAQ3NIQ6_VIGMU